MLSDYTVKLVGGNYWVERITYFVLHDMPKFNTETSNVTVEFPSEIEKHYDTTEYLNLNWYTLWGII